ncbi:hypothetical protein ACJMK2_004521 [Sinanodonta woodiana]|uniref:Uncharacterized protein n=1 Tax=Sinanodonta woodiana TaxID=1069815 RepID=A0ABD3Y1F3_SINWO
MNSWVFCCIVFVASTSCCYGFCQFPPELWCSTPEIVKECRVETHCQWWNCLSQVVAKPVDVVKEIGEIMNLQLVPYGNTEEMPNGDSWKFTCELGDQQCSANIIQACAINFISNISEQFPFIECMMITTGLPEDIAKSCATSLGGINWVEIVGCSREGKGRELEHQMALRTKALETREGSSLPFVTINGKLLGDVTEQSSTDFVNLICRNYQGPFPYGCRKQQSNPTHSCLST